MKWLDRLRIAYYHHKRHKQFGHDKARTLGWQDKYSQISRFEALCRDLDLNDKTILDLGCGYGDLLEFIERRGQQPKSYTGIDQLRSFLYNAEQRDFRTQTEFICGDFSRLTLQDSDYVFASGSLNYQSSNPHHTIEMIERMYATAREGCVFNLLDEAKLPSMKMLASHNKEGVLRYCRILCSRVELVEGYSEHDFTIVMRKVL
ncbi:class I SAM-dependent methyltransferase [Vibrio mytili]|uniref:class I SAM-dependent methyltransferase n=1 Tax=Vibrio mytili TaxID=50718 RepID=UPI003C6EFC46